VQRVEDEAVTGVQEQRTRDRARAANIAHAALTMRPQRAGGSTVLVLSFVAFLLASSRGTSLAELAGLVGVLLFHEGGHLVGMRLFGFADLRMFFLPFVGAAASGRKPAASAVEQAIVSLLGPVPGIVLGLVLAFFADKGHFPDGPLPPLAHLVVMLVLVNAFNLLPILPLDGGRLFQTLLFARTPALDVLFRLLAIAGLGWLAFQGFTILGVVAAFMLVTARTQARVAFEAARLRRAYSFTPDVASAGDEELAALHAVAERATAHLRTSEATKKRIVQQTVRDIFDRVAHAPPKWWQTVLLLLVWLCALIASVVALAVLFRSRHL
jgi:Zn-dependent protease